jgi:hypothetical protein
MLHFNCQHCRKKCKAPPEAAGKLGRCPRCNRSIQIPLSVEPIGSTAPPSDDKVIDDTLGEEAADASSKSVMLEEEAAGRFVLAMIGVVGRHWAELTADFRPSPEDAERFDDILGGQREFMLAVMAVQFQAVENLCPTDQAKRIRRYIYKLLDRPAMSYCEPTVHR